MKIELHFVVLLEKSIWFLEEHVVEPLLYKEQQLNAGDLLWTFENG